MAKPPISQLEARIRLKYEVFDAYGGPVCACCAEQELMFLSLDHANDDGAEHRRTILGGQHKGSTSFYAWLKRNNFPQDLGLRVLCFNCNMGRQCNEGVCPHVQARGRMKRFHRKLTQEEVDFIKSHVKIGRGRSPLGSKRLSLPRLSRMFGISVTALWKIQRDKPSKYVS